VGRFEFSSRQLLEPLKVTTQRDEGGEVERHPLPALPDDVWSWLCQVDAVRPERVDAARVRLAAGVHPPPLVVADAMLHFPLVA
jgi:hypothetical protein